jgi:hypothetical protein
MREGTLDEYNNCTSTPHAIKRIMPSKRTMTVEWKVMGVTVAEKTEILKRGKVISTFYSINPDYLT